MGRRGAPLARDRPALQAADRRPRRARQQRRVPAVPDPGGRVARAGRGRAARDGHVPARRLHGEGHQGAKRRTSWVNPSQPYDGAVGAFIRGLLAPDGPFLPAFRPFQRLVAAHGAVNSLAQTLLKLTVPGVPDFYQGTELWDLALVDPDNRRPVDFARRQALLEALRARIAADAAAGTDATALCAELLAHSPDRRLKLFLTHRALALRRERAPLFAVGGYRALGADGPGADHLLALARADGTDAVVAAVPRLTVRQGGFPRPILLRAPAPEHTLGLPAQDLPGVFRRPLPGPPGT